MTEQYFEELRKKTRVVVALNDWLTFKEIAQGLLEMNENSFYNFMNGNDNYKKLSFEKAKIFEEYVNDLLELEFM